MILSSIICSNCDSDKLNSLNIPVVYIAEETSVLLIKNILSLREQKVHHRDQGKDQKHINPKYRLSKLTPREIEITELIEKGYSSLEIAHLLFISKRTVDNHRQNIKRKLDVSNSSTSLSKLFSNNLIQNIHEKN